MTRRTGLRPRRQAGPSATRSDESQNPHLRQSPRPSPNAGRWRVPRIVRVSRCVFPYVALEYGSTALRRYPARRPTPRRRARYETLISRHEVRSPASPIRPRGSRAVDTERVVEAPRLPQETSIASRTHPWVLSTGDSTGLGRPSRPLTPIASVYWTCKDLHGPWLRCRGSARLPVGLGMSR
jgi:hypothetical protein